MMGWCERPGILIAAIFAWTAVWVLVTLLICRWTMLRREPLVLPDPTWCPPCDDPAHYSHLPHSENCSDLRGC
jgi:hypothetical protein